MKILSMTATFGKLNNDTLTLKPTLNVINAPNEWGKSTWCAFITAMLYGIDTKERTTATALADKEHYAPWSGAPMSGRMDILWKDRYITLERSTKGRVPMGEFRAYETESGVPIAELNGANCGELLLGVEKSVFVKSGFIRLADMPVTADEPLRRRLNALVTTGDESGTGDILAQKLRDLRNKCRHNKTGQLPQAEALRDQVLSKLEQHKSLQAQLDQIQHRQTELDRELTDLKNHRQALEYAAAQQGTQRLEQAKKAQEAAQQHLDNCAAKCQALPSEDFAKTQLQQLHHLQAQKVAIEAEVLPPLPVPPAAPEIFSGLSAEEALSKANADKTAYDSLKKPVSPLLLIWGILLIIGGLAISFLYRPAAVPIIIAGISAIIAYGKKGKDQKAQLETLVSSYAGLNPEEWISTAENYYHEERRYAAESAAINAMAESLENRKNALRSSIHTATQGLSLEEALQKWNSVLAEHRALLDAQTQLKQTAERVADLSAATKVVAPPKAPDSLTYSPEETARKLQNALFEQQQLQLQAGQCMGQKESLGSEVLLKQQLDSVMKRIVALEDTYQALNIAMDTLADATNELQRRFAPRISQRAQELFNKLTAGRYDRLQLTQELGLNTAAEGETSLQSARWRSDGTIDQIYLSLRLAVAEELTPEAPLVLDDAFVRFDDTRLQSAMEIIREKSAQKQVILFTCHTREKE